MSKQLKIKLRLIKEHQLKLHKLKQKQIKLMPHKLLKHMGEYDGECQELHDTAAAERRFRALGK